ncbi:MAG: hypothetical protein ACJ70O_04675 [Nitrososphaera sp.]
MVQQEQSRRGRRRGNPAVKRYLELQMRLFKMHPEIQTSWRGFLQVKRRRHKEEAIEIEED